VHRMVIARDLLRSGKAKRAELSRPAPAAD